MGLHNLGIKDPHNISLHPGTGTGDGKRGDHVLIAPAYNTSEIELMDLAGRSQLSSESISRLMTTMEKGECF